MDTVFKKRVNEWLDNFRFKRDEVIDLSPYSEEKLRELRASLVGYNTDFRDYMLNLVREEFKRREDNEIKEDIISKEITAIKEARRSFDLINDGLEIVNKLIFIDYDNVKVSSEEIIRLASIHTVIIVCNNQTKVNSLTTSLSVTGTKLYYNIFVTDMDTKQSTDMVIHRCILDALDMYPKLDVVVISRDRGFDDFRRINRLHFNIVESSEEIGDLEVPKMVRLTNILDCTREDKQLHLVKKRSFGEIIDLVPISTIDRITAENEYLTKAVADLTNTVEYLSNLLKEKGEIDDEGVKEK